MTSRQDAYSRSYVAMGYLLGARGEALSCGLASSQAVSELCERLSQAERGARAQVLAGELTTLARVLAEHRLA